MTERPRTQILGLGAICLAVFAAVAALVETTGLPLSGVDATGRSMEDWADDSPRLVELLRLIEVAFGTAGMTVLTVVLAAGLLVRRHPRAAWYAVAVMVATSLATTSLKLLVGRARPDWQDPLETLTTNSFPSGHASSVTAYAAVLVLLTGAFVRRRQTRAGLVTGCVLLVVVVWSDRVLLGRHYPSDVLAGGLLGVGIALLTLAVYSPLPLRRAVSAEPLVEPLTTTRNLHVVLNPSKLDDPGQFEAIVTAMAEEAGWSEPVWHYTTVEDSGTGMAETAAVAGADLVMVCGGDGTVREVCAELAGTGIPVGIVPAGTGNLLARNLDIPLYLRSAIDVALSGQDRAIDLVAVSGDGLEDTHFLVMAGMGFDAAIMEGVNEEVKRRVGWLAYVLSGFRSLMFPAVRLDVSIDDREPTRHRARTVVVGNVGYLQAGMPLLPDAAIDDGLLDVVLLHPQRFLSWIPLALRVLSRGSRTDDTINRMTGATVRIRAAVDTPRQLDGDFVGLGRELTMRCLPGRVLVRVPR